MPDVNMLDPLADPLQAVAAHDKGRHYQLIKNKTPDWLANADLKSIYPLNDLVLRRPEWHVNASLQQQATLKALNGLAWAAHNKVDQKLRHVQDVYAFAEPLLKRAIQDQYGLDLDVKDTYLHIYTPKQLPWYALNLSNGVTSRDVSLLDAALHNFARHETFERYSCYITRPDYRGHFNILRLEGVMSLEQFKQLCRDLDLGARYQRHLNESLLPSEPVAQAYLQLHVIANLKAALKVAAQVALMKNDLDPTGHAVVMGVLDGTEKRAAFYQLSMLDTPLTGILLITSDLEKAAHIAKVIAYIPHDPVSPLKQYASTADFAQDLSRRLQLNAPLASSKHLPQHTYQQFFSQFVPHSRRGVFFATLAERLYQVQWHQRSPLDPAPAWREEPVSKPLLQLDVSRIVGDLWQQLYQARFNKILNDARSLAVSTAQADDNARRSWWDNALKIASSLLNMALLVVTPFVPLLGELMLAYTVYQLTDDVIEGIVELSEGQVEEAAQHIISVITDVSQLAIVGTGGVLAREMLFKPSAFVDSLKAVQVGDTQRLWNPDLAPYARNDVSLPEGSQADASGLHEHRGQKVLHLDERYLIVEPDAQSNLLRVKHPSRPGAYAPLIERHASGAWVHEGEAPQSWDSQTLRSRLGPMAQGLTPAQLEQACEISGTHDGALRMMYANHDSVPPLLADSLKRLKLRDEVRRGPERIRTGAAIELPTNWAVQMISELPGWPANKAIKVFTNSDLSGYAMTYGAIDATEADTLRISHQAVEANQLPEHLSVFLNDAQFSDLLADASLPDALSRSPAERTQALRNYLADKLEQEKIVIFNHLYSTGEVLDTAQGRLIQQQFAQLPKDLVASLLLRVSPEELEVMSSEQRIPLRLKNLARELVNEVRASHASEGFYNDAWLTPDTERMALNILRLHTDALGDLSIAVREQTANGALRCQVGPEDAGSQKILLHKGQGRYQIHAPHPPAALAQYSFYEAVLRVVPPDALDYRPGQGEIFKQWLKQQLEPPVERRTVLQAPTRRRVDERAMQVLLQKPMFKTFRRWLRGEPSRQRPTIEEALTRLCPRISEEQIRLLTPQLITPQGEELLRALEADHAKLLEELEVFRNSHPTLVRAGELLALDEQLIRTRIIIELRHNWEDGAYMRMLPPQPGVRGTLLDLSDRVLGRYIRRLEPLAADFSHVTCLNLSGTRLGDGDSAFLDNFRNLRAVDLSHNNLSAIPPQLPNMNNLRALNLSENPIAWRPSDYATLAQCPHLRSLNLEGNTRLEIPPDISHMPDLRQLVLRRTSISQWPGGLESPRLDIPELDLSNTAVRTVPEFALDSVGARIVAGSWLDRTRLERLDEDRFVSYRRAFGIDPYRTVPRGGRAASQYWLAGLKGETLALAAQVWEGVEREHGSQGFFDVLRLLQPPTQFQTEIDAQLYQQGRDDLAIRVWQILFAVDENPQFRERIFSLAGVPANCADAGAHIFNRMGVETLLEDILQDNSPQGLATREARLAQLARQSWRLDQVNRLAREEIRHRTAPENEGGLAQAFGSGDNEVDDVQVYLAYQTGLKARLDLPWLSEHMVYRNTARVTSTHLNEAARRIDALEQGEGLVDGMLEQGFWSDYLQDAYLQDFTVQREARNHAGSQLDDLLELQKEWSDAQVTPQRKADVRQRLVALADELAIAVSEVLTDEPLSDETVLRLYTHIQRDYNELARRLTRQALTNAGLQASVS
jgi:hypothetical protein